MLPKLLMIASVALAPGLVGATPEPEDDFELSQNYNWRHDRGITSPVVMFCAFRSFQCRIEMELIDDPALRKLMQWAYEMYRELANA